MSFWGKVGELGKSAINATVDAAKEANAEKERYKDELRERNYSEAKLRELFRTTSSASRKMAIASIMRERGFYQLHLANCTNLSTLYPRLHIDMLLTRLIDQGA